MPLTESCRILNNSAVLQQQLGQSAEAKRLMSEAMAQAEAADYEDKAGYLVTMRFNMARILEVRAGPWRRLGSLRSWGLHSNSETPDLCFTSGCSSGNLVLQGGRGYVQGDHQRASRLHCLLPPPRHHVEVCRPATGCAGVEAVLSAIPMSLVLLSHAQKG